MQVKTQIIVKSMEVLRLQKLLTWRVKQSPASDINGLAS